MKKKMGSIIISTLLVLAMGLGSNSIKNSYAAEDIQTSQNNWWDKFGDPHYGGTLTIHFPMLDTLSFDPHYRTTPSPYEIWVENLFGLDWALDRKIFAFNILFVPPEYSKGLLAESWEQTDPTTITVKIRKGVHWQDKPPVNGREFTAEDVQFTFDSILGTGSGFSKPNPTNASWLSMIDRVVVTDKYTVEFRLKQPGALAVLQMMSFLFPIIAPEWRNLDKGDSEAGSNPINDWHNAVGTGPWILTDFIQGTSLTYAKNPNYWGHDERYPKNQLPYADQLRILNIPDMATAISALRTGKIDYLSGITWQQGEALTKSNPDIQQFSMPWGGVSINFRCDTAPFTDIRVRKALQMAVDIKTIAKTVYGGKVNPAPLGLISPRITGWASPYNEWPKEYQDEYIYNFASAQKLLTEAGYPDGFKTNILLGNPAGGEICEVIKAMFKDVNVDMEIKVVDSGTFRSLTWAGNYDQMTYEAKAGMSWAPSGSYMQRLSTAKTVNLTYNNDKHYDELVGKIEKALTIEEAKELSREIDLYCISQHWSLNLCETVSMTGLQNYIKGYSGESMGGSILARLWIDQKMKTSLGR